ncbi:MAG: hypothetical protein E6J83_14855 [Deltaproteobacteria bacterium]|nr:MAG: hypothetical protein E6J83_14855 [Deltaproteobacteria bacterium]
MPRRPRARARRLRGRRRQDAEPGGAQADDRDPRSDPHHRRGHTAGRGKRVRARRDRRGGARRGGAAFEGAVHRLGRGRVGRPLLLQLGLRRRARPTRAR